MKTIAKILCALDLSDQSQTVAEHATLLAQQFNAPILAVYVTPVLSHFLGLNVSAGTLDKLSTELRSGGSQELKEFIASHFEGVEVEPMLLTGYPAEEIVKLASSAGADLIVMGTHGHQGLNRIIFGSVAEGVVKNSPVPVITIRPDAATAS